MAETEKLTLAVDIEIAKHDLLLDRFVAEVEKRIESVADQRKVQKDYERLLDVHTNLKSEHDATRRRLDQVCRDYDHQSKRVSTTGSEREEAVAALRELLTTTELYLEHVHQNPKTRLALRSQLSSAVGVACVKAGDLLRKQEEIPF